VSLTTHEIGFESLDALTGVEALCLFVGEDDRPLRGAAGFVDWRLCGKLSRVLMDGFFVGQRNDTLLIPSENRIALPRIFAVGVGSTTGFAASALSEVLSGAANMLNKARINSVAVEVPGLGSLDDATRAELLSSVFVPRFSGSRVAVLAEKPLAKLILEHQGKGQASTPSLAR